MICVRSAKPGYCKRRTSQEQSKILDETVATSDDALSEGGLASMFAAHAGAITNAETDMHNGVLQHGALESLETYTAASGSAGARASPLAIGMGSASAASPPIVTAQVALPSQGIASVGVGSKPEAQTSPNGPPRRMATPPKSLKRGRDGDASGGSGDNKVQKQLNISSETKQINEMLAHSARLEAEFKELTKTREIGSLSTACSVLAKKMTVKYTKVLDQSQQLSEVEVDEDNATNTKQKTQQQDTNKKWCPSLLMYVCASCDGLACAYVGTRGCCTKPLHGRFFCRAM